VASGRKMKHASPARGGVCGDRRWSRYEKSRTAIKEAQHGLQLV